MVKSKIIEFKNYVQSTAKCVSSFVKTCILKSKSMLQAVKTQTINKLITLKVILTHYISALKGHFLKHIKAFKQTISASVAHIVKVLRDTKDSIKQIFDKVKSYLQLTKLYYSELIKSSFK